MKIKLENVKTGYDREAPVLDGLSIELGENRFYGIVGPNGSGKTTLLRVLAALLPYEGSICLQSQSLQKTELSSFKRKELASHIALMPQFSSIYFSYTAYDTVMLGRYIHLKSGTFPLKKESAEDREAVQKALSLTGLDDISHKEISTLSGGQLQRVMLARTIAQATPIILLDEPTNHLDLKYQSELMEYLDKWAHNNNTVVAVFHDISMAARYADELIYIKDGKCLSMGTVSDTMKKDILQDVYDMDVAGFMKSQYDIWNRL